jgi:sortase A
MMSQKKNIIRKALIIIGASLLVAAILILVAWQWNIHASERKSAEYVSAIRELIPEPQGAVPEERRDNNMATLSIEGIDFAGILELPRFNSVLPIGADWENPSKYPCRFGGSVYDRTIQIGGTSQKGQYDFYRDISVGDRVFFTDVEGNRFSYSVTAIRYEKNADRSALQRENAALTLFIKNVYAFEYVVVYCDVLK